MYSHGLGRIHCLIPISFSSESTVSLFLNGIYMMVITFAKLSLMAWESLIRQLPLGKLFPTHQFYCNYDAPYQGHADKSLVDEACR